jgi:hypothetical protein
MPSRLAPDREERARRRFTLCDRRRRRWRPTSFSGRLARPALCPSARDFVLQPNPSGISQRFQTAKRFGMANGGLVLEVLKERLSDTRDVGLVKTPVAEIATDQFWTSGLMRAAQGRRAVFRRLRRSSPSSACAARYSLTRNRWCRPHSAIPTRAACGR